MVVLITWLGWPFEIWTPQLSVILVFGTYYLCLSYLIQTAFVKIFLLVYNICLSCFCLILDSTTSKWFQNCGKMLLWMHTKGKVNIQIKYERICPLASHILEICIRTIQILLCIFVKRIFVFKKVVFQLSTS